MRPSVLGLHLKDPLTWQQLIVNCQASAAHGVGKLRVRSARDSRIAEEARGPDVGSVLGHHVRVPVAVEAHVTDFDHQCIVPSTPNSRLTRSPRQ